MGNIVLAEKSEKKSNRALMHWHFDTSTLMFHSLVCSLNKRPQREQWIEIRMLKILLLHTGNCKKRYYANFFSFYRPSDTFVADACELQPQKYVYLPQVSVFKTPYFSLCLKPCLLNAQTFWKPPPPLSFKSMSVDYLFKEVWSKSHVDTTEIPWDYLNKQPGIFLQHVWPQSKLFSDQYADCVTGITLDFLILLFLLSWCWC